MAVIYKAKSRLMNISFATCEMQKENHLKLNLKKQKQKQLAEVGSRVCRKKKLALIKSFAEVSAEEEIADEPVVEEEVDSTFS